MDKITEEELQFIEANDGLNSALGFYYNTDEEAQEIEKQFKQLKEKAENYDIIINQCEKEGGGVITPIQTYFKLQQ